MRRRFGFNRSHDWPGIAVDGLSPEDVPSGERAGDVASASEVIVTGTFDGTSASPASTTPPATAAPSLIAPMLVITDEERAWAAESVASDLRDATNRDVTATMAKTTFEEYEALWDIDVPEPPGPPASSTAVIVVTLSASLDNRAMRGPLGGHTEPATGTINVIDASTGESIMYATLLGEETASGRITELGGPIEDVELPEGFR